jgi:dephospho-CoA kinase
MYIVGLTGGIGSGKTTVAQQFETHGVTVIDADQIAHQLSQPGEAGYQAMLDLFGTDILQANGYINRKQLREKVFSSDALRADLEAALHPLIRQTMMQQAQQAATPYCILSIPLLTESNNFDGINRVLVVDCPEALQRQRATKRDNSSTEQIEHIMAAQNSREERLSYADDVIVNDSDLEHIEKEVAALHQLYLKLKKVGAG